MLLLLVLACGDAPPEPPAPEAAAPAAPAEPEAIEITENTPSETKVELPALPVALYVAAGGAAAPLGAVPAVAPGGAPKAVSGAESARWPSEGVDARTLTGQDLRFTGAAPVPCSATDGRVSGVGLEEAAVDGALIVAPASWAGAWRAAAPVAAGEELRAQVLGRRDTKPASIVQVALNEDLDGDGMPERLVLAHAPPVEPEKPGVSQALWGAELQALEGFEFNGALSLEGWMPTPAGGIVVLRSRWMGGEGVHAFGVEGGSATVLGEWVCGS